MALFGYLCLTFWLGSCFSQIVMAVSLNVSLHYHFLLRLYNWLFQIFSSHWKFLLKSSYICWKHILGVLVLYLDFHQLNILYVLIEYKSSWSTFSPTWGVNDFQCKYRFAFVGSLLVRLAIQIFYAPLIMSNKKT